ncbi:MAG: hypothetical protein ACHQQQ_04825 [Bacteroidota bacterium]
MLIVSSLLLLSEIAYGMLFSGMSTQIILFIVVSIIASCFYILICLIIHYNVDALTKNLPVIIIASAFIFRLTVIWINPVASGDVYRYLWDGKVQLHGFNPYAHPPADSVLTGLSSGTSLQSMDYHAMRTIYPPFSEWIFTLGYSISGDNALGIKFFLLVAECFTAWLLILILKEIRKPLAYIGFYLICPLPIMQFMIDAHMDALAFPFVLLCILLWMKRKPLHASVALGFGIISKLLPVLFIPLLLRGEDRSRKLILLFGSFIVVVLSYLPYILGGGSPWEALSAYSSRWYFNGPVFDLAHLVIESNEAAHLFVACLFILWLVYVYTREWIFIEKIYFTLMGFFLLSATVHPWYVTWLALMLPLVMRWSGVAYITLVNLANIVVIDYKALKIWHLSPLIEIAEYLPIIILVLLELNFILKSRAVTEIRS